MESFAVADTYARKHNRKIDANQELFALGLSNIFGSFFNGYPVTGGFSRTAVNEGAGARTSLAAIISSLIVLIVIFLLTESFEYMPNTILASIVFVAVSSLFDFHAFSMAWKVARKDFWVSLIAFLATLCLGTEIGLAVGFGMSVLLLLQGVAFPHTAILGFVRNANSGEVVYRNLNRFPEAKPHGGVLFFRIDASFTFVNRSTVLARLHEAIHETDLVANAAEFHPAVVLACEGINAIDVAGLEALHELSEFLHERGISLAASSVKGPVRDALEKQNAYLVKHNKEPILVWAHNLASKGQEIKFPASFMTATAEEAFDILRMPLEALSQV